MSRISVMLTKELLELRRARSLLLGTTIPPLILTLLPILLLSQLDQLPEEEMRQLKAAAIDPALAGLAPLEMLQASVGKQFSTLQLLMPLFIPSIIAAHSVVGEKTRRTLEPLLATPIRTHELLLAKSIAAIIPAIVITWFCGGLFALCVHAYAVSPAARDAILGPGWLLMILLCAPLMSLLSTSASVLISARVNDPRTAQQLSAVVAVPVMLLFFLQLLGTLVVSPSLVLVASLVIALLDALVLWISTRVFRREVILTKWS